MKKRLSLQDKAMLAMREAIRDVIEQYKKDKMSLAVWDWKKIRLNIFRRRPPYASLIKTQI